MAIFYDEWRTGWTDLGYDVREDQYTRIKDMPDMEAIKKSFYQIVKALYTDGMLDVARLDDNIFQMGEQLGIQIPDDQPKIARFKS